MNPYWLPTHHDCSLLRPLFLYIIQVPLPLYRKLQIHIQNYKTYKVHLQIFNYMKNVLRSTKYFPLLLFLHGSVLNWISGNFKPPWCARSLWLQRIWPCPAQVRHRWDRGCNQRLFAQQMPPVWSETAMEEKSFSEPTVSLQHLTELLTQTMFSIHLTLMGRCSRAKTLDTDVKIVQQSCPLN